MANNQNCGTAIPANQVPIAYQLEIRRIIEADAYLLAKEDAFKRPPEEYWLAAEKAFIGQLYRN